MAPIGGSADAVIPALEEGVLRALFDALPFMAFLVDQDVKIEACNRGARLILGSQAEGILHRRAGEAMHCLHSKDVPEGCGHGPACGECIVRNSVREAFAGGQVVRRRARVQLEKNGAPVEIYALITANRMDVGGVARVLLLVEDISDLADLRRIIPICSSCRKVRDDKESWMRVEAYFNDRWDLDFSHGYCPDCLKVEMDNLDRTLPPKPGQE